MQIGAEPMLRATLVELEDGLVAEPLAGKGRLVAAPRPRYDAMHAHCEMLVVGAGRSGRAAAAAATGRTILAEQFRVRARLDGDLRVLERTTVVAHLRRQLRGRGRARPPALADPREADRARDRRARAAARLPRQRPPRASMLAGAVAATGSRRGRDTRSPAAGARASTSGARRAAGSAGTTGSARRCPTASCAGVECVGRRHRRRASRTHRRSRSRRRRGHDVRRPRARRDRRRPPPRRRRRPPLRRARQALHDDRHRLRPGQDGQRERDPRRRGAARRPSGRARHDHVPPALHPRLVRAARRPQPRRALRPRPRDADPRLARRARRACSRTSASGSARATTRTTGESMDEAVLRECRAVREGVGMHGRVARSARSTSRARMPSTFLEPHLHERVRLARGRPCRYGADVQARRDGVRRRRRRCASASERFVCTTTTGNAARVLDWHGGVAARPSGRSCGVWLTSVTEQWATVAVVGPDSRDAARAAAPRSRSTTRASRSWRSREGEVAGIPARVCRVSFSGELAFEVNVDGRRGLELWEAIYGAGERDRRTAPRRCTSCAPRRATRSSARTPTGR